ncbi:MAG: RagB/SusD family nutrient uptake outer membrane protein [Bacteroidales bacterium]|nr:RagB/SusD family nutrient uptake outer membrane protein [Bacteroidales bacterium]
MKSFKKYIIAGSIGVLATMGISSCTGDLDLLPTDPSDTTAASFDEDPDSYMNAMIADVFFGLCTYGISDNNALNGVADGGFSTFQRGIFNCEELPTDEACWLWYANDTEVGQMPFGIVGTTTAMAFAPYYRFIVNASICNNFIATWTAGESYVSKANEANRMKYLCLARAVREINMFYLLDLYGNVPWIDDGTAVGSTPTQYPASEIYDKLVAEMEETLASFDTYVTGTPVYGYFGKDALDAYLMKLYMNAAQFGKSANDWSNAYAHAMNIINRHKGEGFNGSGLCYDYNQVFGAGNKRFAPGGGDVNEILFTLPQEDTKMTTYAGAELMCLGYGNTYGDGSMQDMYNVSGAWNCILGRKQLAEAFDWNDDAMSQSDDQRVRFWMTSAHGYSFSSAPLNADNCPNNGYPTIKFTNWYINNDGSIDYDKSGDVNANCWNTDYPMVRLAEIYLSAAECILNGGGGSQSDALTYVNYIRERAGISAWSQSQLTIETLKAERQRELYTECTRRTDLKRYGTWISGSKWDYKGSDSNYSGQDFPSNFNWYPLPPNVCSMAGYDQNPGY